MAIAMPPSALSLQDSLRPRQQVPKSDEEAAKDGPGGRVAFCRLSTGFPGKCPETETILRQRYICYMLIGMHFFTCNGPLSCPWQHPLGGSTHQLKSANAIAIRLAKALEVFSVCCAYTTTVAVYFLLAFIIADAGGQYAELDTTHPAPAVIYVIVAGHCIAVLIIQLLMVFLGLSAARHLRKAGAAKFGDEDVTGNHLEKAVLFLAALFKTMAMTAYILMLLEVSAAAAILPLLVAVVAVSVVFVALFWLSGFVALSGWYGSSKQASTSYAVGLMSSPIEELENVPAYVKLWLFEVFGRFPPERSEDGVKQRSNHREFELMLEHYKSVVFTKGQLHCLKLLPEAMINASRALVCRVCSGALVLATHLVARRWGSVAIQVLEMLSCASAAGIVLSGAVVFERAIRGDGSHVQRLFLGFCSLRNTSRRLAYLLFVTATLQVVSQLVGMLAV